MFTGLIQSIGKIKRNSFGIIVEGFEPFSPIKLGDSISVDGVCLTVAKIMNNSFLVDISEETLQRTNLGKKADKNSYVNLEPALRLSDRLGGHIVSGHIDGMGEVVSIENLNNSWNVQLCWYESKFCRYMCDKASISINGISLTVADISDNGCKFSVAVIPHTWTNTCLQFFSLGEQVNLEVDLMAKYAEKLLMGEQINVKSDSKKDSIITGNWLNEQGWM